MSRGDSEFRKERKALRGGHKDASKHIKLNKHKRRRLRSTVEKELREVNPFSGHVRKFRFF